MRSSTSRCRSRSRAPLCGDLPPATIRHRTMSRGATTRVERYSARCKTRNLAYEFAGTRTCAARCMKDRRRAVCKRMLRAAAPRTPSIAREESRGRGCRIAGKPAARARHIAVSLVRAAREPPRGSFPSGRRRVRKASSTRAGVARSGTESQHSSHFPPSRVSEACASRFSLRRGAGCPSNAGFESLAPLAARWRAAAGFATERQKYCLGSRKSRSQISAGYRLRLTIGGGICWGFGVPSVSLIEGRLAQRECLAICCVPKEARARSPGGLQHRRQ